MYQDQYYGRTEVALTLANDTHGPSQSTLLLQQYIQDCNCTQFENNAF